MLKKCLKYDLRAIFRLWLILSIIVISVAVVFGALTKGFETSDDMPLLQALLALLLIPSMMALAVYPSAIMVIISVRYYTSFYTDEGYLTFTLPVKRSTLYNSKLISAAIYMLATTLVMAFAIAIIGSVPSALTEGYSMLDMLRDLGGVVSGIAGSGFFGIMILITLPITAFASGAFSVLFYYFCVTFGSMIAKKMKILAIIGTFYVGSATVGTLFYIAIYAAIFGAMFFAMGSVANEVAAIVWLAIMMVTAIIVMACGFLYRFTLSLIERRLNLA